MCALSHGSNVTVLVNFMHIQICILSKSTGRASHTLTECSLTISQNEQILLIRLQNLIHFIDIVYSNGNIIVPCVGSLQCVLFTSAISQAIRSIYMPFHFDLILVFFSRLSFVRCCCYSCYFHFVNFVHCCAAAVVAVAVYLCISGTAAVAHCWYKACYMEMTWNHNHNNHNNKLVWKILRNVLLNCNLSKF